MYNSQVVKKGLFICLIIISLMCFILSYSVGLGNDEFFTMGLIRHSYLSLINIDALDVHPPLYYMVLKLFLQITTFWTNSIIIKVLFSRLLSLIFFAVTFIILLKILRLFNVHINMFILFAVYFIYGCVLSYSITIRMYQMDIMLLSLEFYGLLLLKYKHIHTRYLILILVSIILSFYTNYFSAVFAGSFLLVDLISYLMHHNIRKSLCIISIGLLDVTLYLPCLPFTLNQVRYVSHSNYSNFVGSSGISQSMYAQLLGAFTGRNITNFQSIIISVFFAIIELFIIFYVIIHVNLKLRKLLLNLYLVYILGFIPSIVLSYIAHPMIEARYGVPLFNIIFFFLVTIGISNIDTFKYKNFLSIVILLLFIILGLRNCSSIFNNDINTINTIKKVNIFKESKSHVIRLDTTNSSEILKPLYYSLYLPNNCHKIIIVKHMAIKNILASNNVKLITKTFNNIKLDGRPGKVYY